MFERRLMAAGGWDVQLRPDTKFEILDQLDESAYFGHVIITRNWVDPTAMTAATLGSVARYAGVYRNRSDDALTLSGAGLAMWLGDENDKGKLTTAAIDSVTNTFAGWVSAIVGAAGTYQLGNGIIPFGTVEALAGSYTLKKPPLVTARTLLDDLCTQAGAEWRISPADRVIWAGSTAFVFPTAIAPTTVLLREGGSRDVNYRGLPVTAWGDEMDAEDYATGVLVPYNDDAAYVADRITPPYKQLAGADIVMERAVDGNEIANGTNAANLAARERAKTDDIRVHIAPAVDVWDIGESIIPGDTIYVYEPRLGLVDTTTQIPYRGEIIFPVAKRVFATTQPIRQGMGVYMRLPDSTGTIIDLTDWVEFEDGDCTLEVGAPRRSLLRQIRRGEAAA